MELKTVKIYLLLFIIFLTTSLAVKAQFILPTLHASSYVPIKVSVKYITQITDNSAKAFVVTSASTNGRTSAGVCWSTSSNPTTADNLGSYTGTNLSFTIDLTTGLVINTVYYVRPFTIINGNTFYGEVVVFKTTNGVSTATDGKVNFVTMNTPGGTYSNNEIEFDSQIQPGYASIIQAGVANISVVLDFINKSTLNSAGINVSSSGEKFSIVASGFFIPTETGTYTFTCEGDDAVDLFVNGVNVANHYGGHAVGGLGSHTGTISLTAGTKYSIRARMQEFTGQEGLRVFWRKPSQTTGWFQDVLEMSSY